MAQDAAKTLSMRIRADLTLAMRERRTPETALLRALLAAIDDAQAPPAPAGHQPYRSRDFGSGEAEVPRVVLAEDDLRDLLEREAAHRREAAATFAGHGRAADAARLEEEADRILRYLA